MAGNRDIQIILATSSSRSPWPLTTAQDVAFSYGGEGLYYFVEQFVWLAKSGLIDKRLLPNLQKISQWAEFVGYTGSISLKIRDLRGIREEEACLESSIEIATSRGIGHKEEDERWRELMGNKLMKRLSILQDLADDLTALADIRDGRGRFTGPLLVPSRWPIVSPHQYTQELNLLLEIGRPIVSPHQYTQELDLLLEMGRID
ncbi:hypothetical protein SAY87_031558 [Trapa incisa]|uniref:Uncharacterized protein n=1 Tax=Trapa incisa TaxID=236973 RepID=A0AAN7KPN2_9MYRT|nr:hypothetical protein SAY87_031558 [Trapa incisa]